MGAMHVVDGASLMREAETARANAYCPYSGYAVGAALLSEDGRIFLGCNIENAAFTPTICAERTAFFRAVSSGTRSFRAIAVTGGPAGGEPAACTPCGVCRQVMMEFCDPDSFVVFCRSEGDTIQGHLLRELLPLGFGPSNLETEGGGGA